MKEIKYKIIKIAIPESGSIVKFSSDTDKMYKTITGLFVSLPEDNAVPGCLLELKVADKEIFPEEFEVKMITTGLNVSPNKRFYNKISEDAAGNRIDGRFVDAGKSSSYPYVAKLYVRLEERI
jgi:hypothetical protein